MKNMSVVFQNRDFTSGLDATDVKFQVERYNFKAIGGCAEATITATGGELAIWELINWLRKPVTIYDHLGVPVWWGYVHQVQIRQGALEVAATLDTMTNRVAVIYSYVEEGTQDVGTRKITTWADNLDSQAEFGIKELLSSASGMSDAAAAGRRGAILLGQAWPQGGLSMQGVETSKTPSATLICRGWWGTLGWKYASMALVAWAALYFETWNSVQAVGAVAGNQQVAQQILVGAQAINASQVQVLVRKNNAPTDNLVVGLYAVDSANKPTGSALASGTVAGTDLTTTLAWTAITLSAEVQLAAATKYAVVQSRSTAVNATNYYETAIDTADGYTDGPAWVYDGSVWTDPGWDMPFKIMASNDIDTVLQIQDLVSTFGQFMVATDIDARTGILRSSYLDGESSALTEILTLMEAGGANGRRLLASVDANRRVQIWEEPATSTAGYTLDNQAKLYGMGGIPVNQLMPPVGVWCRLKDVLPGVVDLTKLVDPSLQFIEGSSWSASGGAAYEFKGRPGVDSLLSIGG